MVLTLANDVESPVCDDVVDVAIEQFDPIEPVGVGVVIVVAVNEVQIETDLLELFRKHRSIYAMYIPGPFEGDVVDMGDELVECAS